ncbi:MAG: toprim domain-containing protein [Treponema sp.]|nr:toprim domain-containing protein [Treponema sp.]
MQDIFSLKANIESYLERRGVDVQKASRSNTVCPVCGGGVETGCFHYYADVYKVKCFSCGFNGDLFDLIAEERGITNAEAIAEARKMYGDVRQETVRKRPQQESKQEEETDHNNFLLKAEQANNYRYLQGRGISPEVQRRFHVGFVEHWRSPQAVRTILERGGNPENVPTSPRCIIPRNRYNFLARDVRDEKDIPANQRGFIKQNTGNTSLFNADALEDSIAFITEGEIDAMSIVEVGGNACALCSTANRQLLLTALERKDMQGKVLILMLDNDISGRQGQAELEKGLKNLEIAYVKADYPKGIKDPNEWLMSDKVGMKTAIFLFKAKANRVLSEQNGNKYNAADLLEYFKTIEEQPAGFEAKTGFEELDKNLFGGLHEGLYIIGAISSLGKTTFTLQLADQVAAGGQDVIFFSLEMSKYELMSKSLSRLTYQLAGNRQTGNSVKKKPLARDTQQILNNRRYASYNSEEREIIKSAIREYEKSAPHIYIYEGRYRGERLKVSHIREIVSRHIKSNGQKPVVLVDYLQILAPVDVHATDKQNTDTNTFELKEISRDFQIPVIAVSSFNRDNYQEPVSMQSFKESGAIEYSSDILFGLQYAGMDYKDGESSDKRKSRLRKLVEEIFRKKKEREPIAVDLKCLKQRTGYQFSVSFAMMSAYNHFAPISEAEGFTADNEPTVDEGANPKRKF